MERIYQEPILIIGGSSGIGRKTVAEFKRLGAENLYLGSTSAESFDKALAFLKKQEKIDVSSGIYPFVADVRNKSQLNAAAKEIRAGGRKLKTVIYSQASGMESFTERLFSDHLDSISIYTLNTPVDELSRTEQEIVSEKMADMRKDLLVWTEEALPKAIEVNFEGTKNVTEVLAETFPDGFTGVFYNSTWGEKSGVPGVEIPLLYRPVDLSKAMVRDWMKQEGPGLHRAGFDLSELVASLVKDSKVGKMFIDYLLNLMEREQRDAVRNSSIFARDVVTGARRIVESDPSKWQNYPKVEYIYAQKGNLVISDNLELSAMYTNPYPF